MSVASGSPRSYRLGRAASLSAVAYAFLVAMLGTTMPTPLYPIYQSEIGFSGLMVTIVFAVYAVGVIAGLLLFGGLSDQIGRRDVLLAGLVLSAISAAVFLLPGGLTALIAGRLLSGLSAGVFTGTATATLIDLAPPRRRARAGLVAAAVNMGGLGLGPLLAGVLAQYAPAPLTLCFVVDLVLLVPAAAGVWLIPEPVENPGALRIRAQRLHIPPEVRGTFVRAATAGFAGFAVLGLFTAVSSSFLGQVLHRPNHALVGLVVFALFVASTAGQFAVGYLAERRALLAGCAVLAVGVCVVGAALWLARLDLLVLGAVVAGLGQGASFRAGLGAVGSASPAAHRGEVSSSFFVVIYVALSAPVIGVGALAQAVGLVVAGVVFALLVAVLALVAFGSIRRRAPG